MKPKTLVFYCLDNERETKLSYQEGWVKEFYKNEFFNSSFINLSDFYTIKRVLDPNNFKYLFEKFDLIIFLHSAFSNADKIPTLIKKIIKKKKSIKVYLAGNEYKCMDQKIEFTNFCEIDFFITQCDLQGVIDKYKSVLKAKVYSIPGGGLDLDYFYPKKKYSERSIDIGFRAFNEPWYFGHQERETLMIASAKVSKELNLKTDLSMKEEDRLNRNEWASFLNNCKSIISSNAGFDYFDTTDNLRNIVIDYQSQKNGNKDKVFKDIYEKFFKDKDKTIINRQISGRNIESAGTKTLQILIEGNYRPFLPDVHYIAIKKDLSNLSSCLEKISDEKFVNKIINNAYSTALNSLQFKHHLSRLYKIIYE